MKFFLSASLWRIFSLFSFQNAQKFIAFQMVSLKIASRLGEFILWYEFSDLLMISKSFELAEKNRKFS